MIVVTGRSCGGLSGAEEQIRGMVKYSLLRSAKQTTILHSTIYNS